MHIEVIRTPCQARGWRRWLWKSYVQLPTMIMLVWWVPPPSGSLLRVTLIGVPMWILLRLLCYYGDTRIYWRTQPGPPRPSNSASTSARKRSANSTLARSSG